ncbi:MAG: tRNA (adenosine(37)-N6)-threonylcarbamoyltransferase complex ATPase subunit type 1 TsaE [Acholeplasmataceae bacterium]
MKTRITNNARETEMLGYELGLLLKKEERIVILLDGDLGTGKTTLTKGIAKALGVTEIVNSPTFTIMKKYSSKSYLYALYHLDLYRLTEVGQDFDLEEYIDGKGMIVIEWPFQVKDFLPKDYLLVEFEQINVEQRKIKMTCIGYPCKRAVEVI